MGRVAGPHGIQGWIKVSPFTEHVGALADFPTWWLLRDGQWNEISVKRAEVHGKYLVACVAGCETREEAARWRGADIAVPRECMPALASGEYYWTDLEGVAVRNERDEALGRVINVFSNGAHAILRVQECAEAGRQPERLIPFVAGVVREVSLDEGWVRVAWERDW